ncbi:retrovirus-related pol polyprotein from transposon TNT 1-94 [Tanacetum coccineum]
MKDKVVQNNSQMKIKQKEVEDHHRISSILNKTKFVTACNDSLKSKTSNVNAVCATYGKCVFNSIHDACVSKFFNGVNARSKKPQVVPIRPRKPIRKANQSVATPPNKTVASDSTIQKSRSYYRMRYEKTNKAWKWWIEKQCPLGYQWIPKTKMKWIVQIMLYIVDSRCTKHMTGNLKLLYNFVENYLGTVRFGNDQFTPILGYGDLIWNAFRKSTCYIRDLQGNDLLTDTCGSDLYKISLQECSSISNLFSFYKASPTQAWLWHRRLSHLNFDTINLLSKNDIENNTDQGEDAHFEPYEFINPFCTPVQEAVESSSRNVDTSNMHTFYQRHRFDYRWTKNNPLEKVHGNPSKPVQTRRQLATDPEMYMFALTVSIAEPTNIKEAMADHAWIEAIQEELHQFD